jgi:hypothetical protein
MNLYTRLKHYFKPTSINSGNRLINKNIKEYGIENFKLDIYIINTESSVLQLNSSSLKTLILCLEQYYILILNPSLNYLKVAGSNPIVEHSKSHIDSIKLANSKPVFLYLNDNLIYKASSTIELAKNLKIGKSTIYDGIRNLKKIFSIFRVSNIGPTKNNGINILELSAIRNLIKTNNPRGKNTTNKKIKTTIVNHLNNKSYVFSSITEARSFLVTVGLNLSSKTFYKYKNTNKIYKG